MRTSCSTDQYGNVTYWFKKNFQYNLRGTKVKKKMGEEHKKFGCTYLLTDMLFFL